MIGAKIETTRARRALDELQIEIQNQAHIALEKAAAAATRAARATTAFKDRTGRTRSQTKYGFRSAFKAYVENRSPVARWLEGGTKPHNIFPKDGPMFGRLRFQVNGRWVTTRQVKHPGTKATHFIERGARQAEPGFRVDLERGLWEAVDWYRRG